ncbi:hypothetical protein AOLI_G00165270 [Acnodon oligacanthus]
MLAPYQLVSVSRASDPVSQRWREAGVVMRVVGWRLGNRPCDWNVAGSNPRADSPRHLTLNCSPAAVKVVQQGPEHMSCPMADHL